MIAGIISILKKPARLQGDFLVTAVDRMSHALMQSIEMNPTSERARLANQSEARPPEGVNSPSRGRRLRLA